MTTAIAQASKALGALIVLAGSLLGVPYALVHLGRSPLRPADTLGQALGDLVSGPLDDHTALGLVTVAVWALWAIFAACVIREFAIAATGARTGHLRAVRPVRFTGPFQLAAHRLVASILMVGATTGGTVVPVTAQAATPLVHEVAATVPATAGPIGPLDDEFATPPAHLTPDAAPEPEAGDSSGGGRMIQVAPGDNPWDLAETHLGDGMRWGELFELNNTRVQPDGRVWSDPSIFLPGWQLALPAAPDPAAPVTGDGATVTVTAGDSAWDLAETHLGDGMRWGELFELNKTRVQPDGHVWSDPQLLDPGWILELPTTAPQAPAAPDPAPPASAAPPPAPSAAPPAPTTHPALDDAATPAAEAEEPSDTQEPAATTTPTTAPAPAAPVAPPTELPQAPETAAPPPATTTPSTPATTAPAEPHARHDPATDPTANGDRAGGTDDDAAPVVPVLGVASTVLAVGVLRALRRRRARRAAQLPVAVMPPPPPRSARPAARELLAEADEAAVDRLDAALANLAAGLRPRGGQTCVQPRLVQVTGDRIEVLLDRADPAPPPPWRPEASGRIWVLDPDVDLQASDTALPVPALVTIGAGDADILLDLEAFGVVSLVGDIDACWSLARSMITELSARAEGTIGIEVVGDALEDHVADLDGVRIVDSWDAVDTGIIAGSARMLDAGRWPHTFAARASGRVFDGWAPAVWVCAPSDNPRYHAALEHVGTRPGAGSAIVVAGGSDLGYGLRVVLAADGTFNIPDLGLSGRAQQLSAHAAGQLVELIDDAEHLNVAQTFEFPAPADDDPTTEEDTAAVSSPIHDRDNYIDPDWDVLVRVCGEIHVEGGTDRLPPRETAVATFVALNGTVDIDQIRDAIWGGESVSRKRVQNVISTVRRTLGDAIRYVDEGRLGAGPQLVTDLDLIRRRLAYARHQTDPAARAQTLHEALEWATGKVCTYPSTARRSWTWIDLDNWISTVESLVGTVAYDLGTLYLNLGDPDGATWAARRGIDATGPREQLTLLLVKGYELAGDAPAAAAALRSYERHMDDLGADEHSEALLAAMDRHLTPRPGRAAS